MKKDNTLLEMLAAIGIWGVLIQIVLFIGFKSYLYNAIGLWSGIVISAGMAIHMKRGIEDALDIGGDAADKKLRADAAKRMGMTAIVLAGIFYFQIGNPLTVLLGILALKISAYAQPVVHKVYLLCKQITFREDAQRRE